MSGLRLPQWCCGGLGVAEHEAVVVVPLRRQKPQELNVLEAWC